MALWLKSLILRNRTSARHACWTNNLTQDVRRIGFVTRTQIDTSAIRFVQEVIASSEVLAPSKTSKVSTTSARNLDRAEAAQEEAKPSAFRHFRHP